LEYVIANDVQFSTSGIEITGESESNLVMKAYRLLQKDFDLPSMKIHLHKEIPFGAGLGGGSADGAMMLSMLNKYLNLQISTSRLQQYASDLGSDCPFFIKNKPVFATGRGEIMEDISIDLNNWTIIVVKPPIQVSTAEAFRGVVPTPAVHSLKDLIKLPVEDWKNCIINQFESTVFQQYPEISSVKQKLYQLGAIYASMSGSGSAVYSLFHILPENLTHHFPASYLTFSQKL
jgi:4-diphosphocytidyl-2-C-methyl-D-erythritol kinase